MQLGEKKLFFLLVGHKVDFIALISTRMVVTLALLGHQTLLVNVTTHVENTITVLIVNYFQDTGKMKERINV